MYNFWDVPIDINAKNYFNVYHTHIDTREVTSCYLKNMLTFNDLAAGFKCDLTRIGVETEKSIFIARDKCILHGGEIVRIVCHHI